MKLEHATVLVTGAAGGIASAIAAAFARGGSRLLLTDLDADALADSGRRLSIPDNRVTMCAADITEPAHRSRLVMRAREAGVNVLINAAGLNPSGPLEEQSSAQIELALRVNLLAPMLLVQQLLPVLRASTSAQIVNIGSSFGAIGFPCFSTYSATKFGLRGFSEALRRELAGSRVTVHYVAPRATRTRLVTDRIMAMNAELGVGMDTPEIVAAAVADVVRHERRECSLGWPEWFYAKLNGLFPGLVDRALERRLPTIVRHLSRHVPDSGISITAPDGAMETRS